MAIIKKKIWPESFQLIRDGRKTYDLRLADWKITEGDTLIFQEWDPDIREYTGRETTKTVGYIGKTKDSVYWSKKDIDTHGFQVISLLE
ncbi:DUF3850 domain-containing protein [Candidatus Saccharibacteria bacterium]|nr:DUF3850 domain-containing protein [Candidatus Saccharibacteria bacterium]